MLILPNAAGLSLAYAAVLFLLPRLGCGCYGDSSLFQVAGDRNWVRVRLRLPPGCQLQLNGPSPPPRLSIADATPTASLIEHQLQSFVVKATRQLPGSESADLLHEFFSLEPSRDFTVCLSQHVLVSPNGTEVEKPAVCSQAVTKQLPGPTHWDGIVVLCLFIMYILGMLLLALICWGRRGCPNSCVGRALSKRRLPEREAAAEALVVNNAAGVI